MNATCKIIGTCSDAHFVIFKGKPATAFKVQDGKSEFYVYVTKDNRHTDLTEGKMVCVVGERLDPYYISNGIEAMSVDESGRICSHCGKHHYEGYFLDDAGQYACSEECAIALYDGDAEAFHEDCDFIGGIVYWTEWYD